MFKIFANIIAFIFAASLLIIATTFVYQNIWWFVGIFIALIILFILFLVFKFKIESKKKAKQYEIQMLQEAYDERMKEEERLAEMRKEATKTVEMQEMVEEITAERKHQDSK